MANIDATPPGPEAQPGKAATLEKPGERLPPGEHPKARRRDSRSDVIQFGLLASFVLLFFVTEILSHSGFISNGRFAALVFVALAASVTLYYFLDTVANVSEPGYSLAGAGAVFFVVLSIGLYATRNEDEFTQASDQIKELTAALARAQPKTISGPFLDSTGKSIDGDEANLTIGAFLPGGFINDGLADEHRFQIDGVPPTRETAYTVVVIDLKNGARAYTRRLDQAKVNTGQSIPLRMPNPEPNP